MTIFLCVFYLLVSTGTAINIHYCGKKVQKISLFKSDEKSCCGDKMESNSCCHNKLVVFKIKDNHSSNFELKVNSSDQFAIITNSIKHLENKFILIVPSKTPFKFQHPPPLQKTAIFLKNRSLII